GRHDRGRLPRSARPAHVRRHSRPRRRGRAARAIAATHAVPARTLHSRPKALRAAWSVLELEAQDRLEADALDGRAALDARPIPPPRDGRERGAVEVLLRLRREDARVLDGAVRRDVEPHADPTFDILGLQARRVRRQYA